MHRFMIRGFSKHALIKNLKRLPGKRNAIEMSKLATQRQEWPMIFGTRKSDVFIGSTSNDHVIDVIADFVCVSKLTVLKKTLGQ